MKEVPKREDGILTRCLFVEVSYYHCEATDFIYIFQSNSIVLFLLHLFQVIWL